MNFKFKVCFYHFKKLIISFPKLSWKVWLTLFMIFIFSNFKYFLSVQKIDNFLHKSSLQIKSKLTFSFFTKLCIFDFLDINTNQVTFSQWDDFYHMKFKFKIVISFPRKKDTNFKQSRHFNQRFQHFFIIIN